MMCQVMFQNTKRLKNNQFLHSVCDSVVEKTDVMVATSCLLYRIYTACAVGFLFDYKIFIFTLTVTSGIIKATFYTNRCFYNGLMFLYFPSGQ